MSNPDFNEDELMWAPTVPLMGKNEFEPKRLSRDEFAAQVLNGLYSNPETMALDYQYTQLSELAYEQADAMLAHRDKKTA